MSLNVVAKSLSNDLTEFIGENRRLSLTLTQAPSTHF